MIRAKHWRRRVMLPGLLLASALRLACPLLASTEKEKGEIEAAVVAFVDAVYDDADEDEIQRARAQLERLEAAPIEVAALLRSVRVFDDEAPKGIVSFAHRIRGVEHPVTAVVPDAYDGSKIPVRIMLHGGISRSQRRAGPPSGLENFLHLGHITVLPSGWNESKWWHESQVENLDRIVRRLGRDYNLDTNRITLSGISDGATGAFYLGMRDSSRYAHLLTFIGFLQVLANVDLEGQLHLSNLENLPIYSVNTTDDRLYPFERVRPSLELLASRGSEVVIREQQGGHDTNWYGRERAAIERFVDSHPRDPYPGKLTWATADPERSGRYSWLVIDRLLPRDRPSVGGREAAPNDLNSLDGRRIFPRDRPFGHVEMSRKGRRFVGQSSGVARFRLLLDESVLAEEGPIEVVVNGRTAFAGPVKADLTTLLDWYERDFDGERLYLAQIEIEP